MGFTFKRNTNTGLAAVADPGYTDIKLNKLVVGYFSHRKPHRISLAIHDAAQKCGFIWIKLTKESESEEEAREFLNKHCQKIFEKYNLYQFEE